MSPTIDLFRPMRVRIMSCNTTQGKGHARIYMASGFWISVGFKTVSSGAMKIALPEAVFPEYHGFPLSPIMGLDPSIFQEDQWKAMLKEWTDFVEKGYHEHVTANHT